MSDQFINKYTGYITGKVITQFNQVIPNCDNIIQSIKL